MEVLFSQKIEYSVIRPYKNYSNISSKKTEIYLDTEPVSLNSLDDDIFKNLRLKCINRSNEDDIYLDHPKKKRGKYFYASPSETEIDEKVQIPLESAFKNDRRSFSTTNERHLRQNYGNPFAGIMIYKIERSIVRRDNKITIKLYHRIKRREINWKFFKESISIHSITVDTNTGNFTITEINNNDRAKKKIFRRNYFSILLDIVNHKSLFKMRGDFLDNNIRKKYEETFDNIEFLDAIDKIFDFPTTKYNMSDDIMYLPSEDVVSIRKKEFIDNFLLYFTQKKKIKTPNNFKGLMIYHYPTEKYFKKNERKLIASILDRYGIKSGVTVKLLHTNPDIDIITLTELCRLLGKKYAKYIGNINPTNFDKSNLSKYTIDYNVLSRIQSFNRTKCTDYNISDVERENVISIINSILTDKKITSPSSIKTFYGSLVDHFNMINQIRPYIPEIYLNARNYTDFNNEHIEYSKMLALINKPFVIEYVFDDETVKEIEKRIPIIPFESDYTDDDYLYPVLLKREEEYSEEGTFMHHCVAGYANKDQSIIISLRTRNNEDRLTSEFDIRSGSCLQSRHFCNGAVPQMFEYALTTIKNRVSELARKNKLNWKEKNKVRVVLNGIEIPELPPVLGPREEDIAEPQNNLQIEDIPW